MRPPGTAKGAPRQESAPYEYCQPDQYQSPTNPATGHTIFIRPAGAKWSMRVVPPLIGEDLDRVFDQYSQARGFAGGLRMTRGYAIDAEKPRGADA